MTTFDVPPMSGEEMPTGDLFDGDPIPLISVTPMPDFPTKAFPPVIATMIDGVAEATQTDPAMAGTSALTSLSACTGGHARIQIREGWQEPLNVQATTIANPGERKSAVQGFMTRALLDVEKMLADDSIGTRLEQQTSKQVADQAADRARQAAARAEGPDRDAALADAISAAEFAESMTVIPIPRLVADDVTPEATASLLAEQGGRLAILSAEGGILDIIAGRYSGNVPNMDVYLKGHSGDPIKIDRKGRPPEYIRHPALTLGLMIQPVVLATIAKNQQFHGRGLLARLLYAFPASKVGYRKVGAAPVSQAVITAYDTAIRDLASGMAGWVGDPAILTLTDTAATAMLQIEDEVETALRDTGDLAALREWGSKFVGAIARIAGMLHLARHGADAGPRTPVTAETIVAAYQLGNYYRAAAARAFGEMGGDPVTTDAIYLLDRIVATGKSVLSIRDMLVSTARTRFKTKADMLPTLDRLVDHGYLAPMPPPEPGPGRPPSPTFAVHPKSPQNHA